MDDVFAFMSNDIQVFDAERNVHRKVKELYNCWLTRSVLLIVQVEAFIMKKVPHVPSKWHSYLLHLTLTIWSPSRPMNLKIIQAESRNTAISSTVITDSLTESAVLVIVIFLSSSLFAFLSMLSHFSCIISSICWLNVPFCLPLKKVHIASVTGKHLQ